MRFVVLFALFPAIAFAQGWPKELMVEGNPLPPQCIDKLVTSLEPDESIKVSECIAMPEGYVADTSTEHSVPKGFTGWYYRDTSIGADAPVSYSFGQYLGRFRGGFVLYNLWSGGGSGQFSDISIVKRKGDTLTMHREVAAGDRCNGGITEAWMERGKLFYKINLTPYDMVALSDTSTSLKATDDLESSAASCFATATFTHTTENQPVLQLVSLNQDNTESLLTDTDWARNYRYQPCFNKQFMDAINTGRTTLNRDQLKTFVRGFYDTCVSQKAIDVQVIEPSAGPAVVEEEESNTPVIPYAPIPSDENDQ